MDWLRELSDLVPQVIAVEARASSFDFLVQSLFPLSHTLSETLVLMKYI